MTINSSTIPTKSSSNTSLSQEEETEQDEESAPSTEGRKTEEELRSAACNILKQVEQDQQGVNGKVKPYKTSTEPPSPSLPHVEVNPTDAQVQAQQDVIDAVCAVKSDTVIPLSVQEAYHATSEEVATEPLATASVPATPQVHKKVTEPTTLLESPTRPPPSPTLSHELEVESRRILLSPENPKIIFGCLDDSVVTQKKLITVCMHGDEVCGMVATNRLIQEGFFDSFFAKKSSNTKRLTIIVANPKGVQANKRFIDVNLNRIFHENRLRRRSTAGIELPKDPLYNDKHIKEHYEVTRVQDLADEIAECDEYIDIHSTSAKSHPFALPALDGESELYARTFAVDFVIEQLVKSVKGTSIGWAHALHKKAVCFECGQHEDPNTTEIAKKVIKRFVTEMTEECAGAVLTCRSNEVIRKGFRWNRKSGPPKAFEKVQPNELLAYDDEVGDIKCKNPRGAYIIMPTANPILGEEAWFWGDLKDIRTMSVPDLVKTEKLVSDSTSIKPYPAMASHVRTLEVR